jgi:hypothetical protein
MKSLLAFEAEPFDAYTGPGSSRELPEELGGEEPWAAGAGFVPRTATWLESETSSSLPATGVSYFNWDGVPEQVRELLARCKEPVAVAAAIQAGDRSLDHLSDLVFFGRHFERFVTPPDRDGRFISSAEPTEVYSALSKEWVEIRDKLVRPLLEDAKRRPAVTAPTTPVTTMAESIDLVACLERFESRWVGDNPLRLLSLLRQFYYGAEPWTAPGGRTRFWRDIITCGQDVNPLKTRLEPHLFNALQKSQTVSGIDLGHVFTGLESMVCPTPSVVINVAWVPGPATTVNMPNWEFATWGGDLGSAVAARLFEERCREPNAWPCGGTPRTWGLYIGVNGSRTSYADLNGDIDSYGIGGGLTSFLPGNRLQAIPKLPQPLSSILREYYLNPNSALGRRRTARFRSFAQILGCRVSAGKITNRSDVQKNVGERLASFARAFYVGGLLRDLQQEWERRGVGRLEQARCLAQCGGRTGWSAAYDQAFRTYSQEVVGLLLDWLEQDPITGQPRL